MKHKAVELICPSDSMSQYRAHSYYCDGHIWRCSRQDCRAVVTFPAPIELAEQHNWQLSYVPGHGLRYDGKVNIGDMK